MSVPTKAVKKEDLGRFNVHMKVVHLTGETEEWDIKFWIQRGDQLAMDHYDGSFRCYSLNAIRCFIVSAQEKEGLIEPAN